MKVSAEADLLKTLPCVSTILSMVLMPEIGRVDRFPNGGAPGQLRGFGTACAF